MHRLLHMEEFMMLNKKVIECIAVFGLCGIMSITAVTNSGSSEVFTEEKVLANTGLEYDGYAGVTAALLDCEDENDSVSVVKEDVDFVAAPQQLSPEELEWQNKLMPNVEEFLNVRAEANKDSEVVGKLYKGDVADIASSADGWSQITSGNVVGYVNDEYCIKGTDALEYAYNTFGTVAKVNADGLRVRAEQSEDSEVVHAVSNGTVLNVDRSVETVDGWVAVVYDSQTRYVSSSYVTVSLNVGTGITIEEEQAQIAAAKAAAEAEARERAEKEAASVASSGSSSSPEKSQGSSLAAEADEVTLLAAIIYCEAGGESYETQLAVGAVVVNRVKSGRFPNSIYSVIYQPGQFGPARTGKLERKLARGVSSSCYSAAQEALSGVDNTNGALYFNDGYSSQGIMIGSMHFR